MNTPPAGFITIDLMPLAAAILAGLSCALLGNFLVLRRQSMLGDAVSHSVLPGIVVAFLLTGTRNPLIMLLGAGAAGLLSVLMIDVVRRVGRVEPGAAMGVVFSVFFALGVYLMQQAARNVDLDPNCVLYGDLEALIWFPPSSSPRPVLVDVLLHPPRQVTTLAVITLASGAFIALLYKELRLASFDPELATSLGFRASWLGAMLLALVAAATVAAFEAVGSILVIAMLICPAATARLLTDRFRTQILLSGVIGAGSAAAGYFAGTRLPQALGLPGAVNAAGAIAVTAGAAFAIAALASPTHGVLAAAVRRRALATRIALEDLLGALYRTRESPALSAPLSPRVARAARSAERLGLVVRTGGGHPGVDLTAKGLESARALVRRHRLWETYLVERAGLPADHVHDAAEQLEHLPRVGPRARDFAAPPSLDPQGKRIPGDGEVSPG